MLNAIGAIFFWNLLLNAPGKAKKIIEILSIENREVYIEKGFMVGDVRIVISRNYKGD